MYLLSSMPWCGVMMPFSTTSETLSYKEQVHCLSTIVIIPILLLSDHFVHHLFILLQLLCSSSFYPHPITLIVITLFSSNFFVHHHFISIRLLWWSSFYSRPLTLFIIRVRNSCLSRLPLPSLSNCPIITDALKCKIIIADALECEMIIANAFQNLNIIYKMEIFVIIFSVDF